MPLGADDLQATHVANFFTFRLHLLAFRDLINEGVPFLWRYIETSGVRVLEFGPGHRFWVAAEDDVGAASGHVCGNRHRPEPTGLGDNVSLTLVLFGVEHLVLHASLLKQGGKPFTLFDGDGADEHGQASPLDLANLFSRNRLAAKRLLAGVAIG